MLNSYLYRNLVIMNKIRLLLFVICLFFAGAAIAQNVKPEFKKFLYVIYRPSGTGSNKFVRIETAMEINSDGIMHRKFNIYYDYSGNLSFTGVLGGDTTYRVPDSLILKLNKIFADSKNLKQQTEFKKLSNNAHFYGPYEFISCTNSQGDVYNLVTADMYNKNIEFRDVLRKLLRMRSRVNRNSGSIFRDPELEATILKYHNACKNLPESEDLGSLQVADPGVNH